MGVTKSLLPDDVKIYLKVKKQIDPDKVSALVKFEPHLHQKTIIDTAYEGNFSVMTISCGRRFGKTFAIGQVCTTELLIPNASVLLITPTFANAKTMFEGIERNILSLGIKVVTKDSKSLTFTLENRATIFVVTPKSVTNALGRKFSLIIGDESQDIENLIDLFENYLQPAMSDYGLNSEGFANAKAIFIATARDKSNDMYKLIKRAKSKKYKGYINFTFPTSDNPYIPKEFIEQKKLELDPNTFSREYEGKWSKSSGEMVYYTFTQEKCVLSRAEVEKIVPKAVGVFIAAIDVGFTDNTGYLLAFVEPFSGRIVIYKEYKAHELPMSAHVSEFKAIESAFLPSDAGLLRYIDPTAVQVSNDLSVDHNYYTYPAFNKIDEGVKIVNTSFYKGKLVISEECVELIDEIENLVWQNAATKTIKRSKVHKHFDLSLSTLRYLVATWKLQSDMRIVAV